ncbi:MAG: hypothetical protein EZS28_001613 [Streblomastix strix]|uniref:Uncharacterized protein n=1 Tax=Streblomastix strix TaxID=222440 RepID=A0A5J4X6N2_9EUKA|nr:MAG: hypothetical protein EZS28_001613 [Streblomastix strix]
MISIETVGALASSYQRYLFSLQFLFATIEAFALVALLLTGISLAFFSILSSRMGFHWSYVEGVIQIFIGLDPATSTQPRTMLSVEDATFLIFPSIGKVSLSA